MTHYPYLYILDHLIDLLWRTEKAMRPCRHQSGYDQHAAQLLLLIFHSVILSHFPWFWFRFCQSSSQTVIVDYSGMCLASLSEPRDKNRQCPSFPRWHWGFIRLDTRSLSFHAISFRVRALAMAPWRMVAGFKSVLDTGNPGPTLWVINRAGGGQKEGQGQCVSSRGQKVNCRALPPGPFIIVLTQTDYTSYTSSHPPDQHLSSPLPALLSIPLTQYSPPSCCCPPFFLACV